MLEPRVIELSGSFREQGRQHGEAMAGTIKEIIAEVVPWDTWTSDRADPMLARVEGNLKRFAPGLLEELEGIAEGCGLSYRKVLTYSAFVDVGMAHQWCTAMAWSDSPDGPVLGKTNDIGRHQEKYHQLFRRRSGDGLPAIWFTWPGTVWGGCFLNGAGVASGGASLGMAARNEAGVPSNCMLRILMDRCDSLDAVLRTLDEVPVMHHPQHNVTCWSEGGAMALEFTPEGTFVCQDAGNPYVVATNHFCEGPFVGRDTGEERHQTNSRRRLANLRHLAETVEPGVAGMVRVFTDHAECGGICQHGAEDMWSSAAYVIAPRDRRMLVAQGQPCEAGFGEFTL
jgi:isopenicillin-N N-acyltransferase-like protein